jgi:hypothetical protein
MSLFVVPIAVVGLERMPAGANPDMFVLTLPLSEGQGGLAMLAFLGGFSSATSMVIVESIALATMVSNHIVMPLWLRLTASRPVAGDVRRLVLMSRRLSIAAVLALGYAYYRLSGGSAALAAIGLIAFVGVAQILPAMIGGRCSGAGPRGQGAAAGLSSALASGLYTLFLPSFGPGAVIPVAGLCRGPLRHRLAAPAGAVRGRGDGPADPCGVLVALAQFGGLCGVSLFSFPGPVERVQGAPSSTSSTMTGAAPKGWARGRPEAEELLVMAQRILGDDGRRRCSRPRRARKARAAICPTPRPDFLAALERRLSGVGRGGHGPCDDRPDRGAPPCRSRT